MHLYYVSLHVILNSFYFFRLMRVICFPCSLMRYSIDPEMQMEIDTHISRGQAAFSVQLLVLSVFI